MDRVRAGAGGVSGPGKGKTPPPLGGAGHAGNAGALPLGEFWLFQPRIYRSKHPLSACDLAGVGRQHPPETGVLRHQRRDVPAGGECRRLPLLALGRHPGQPGAGRARRRDSGSRCDAGGGPADGPAGKGVGQKTDAGAAADGRGHVFPGRGGRFEHRADGGGRPAGRHPVRDPVHGGADGGGAGAPDVRPDAQRAGGAAQGLRVSGPAGAGAGGSAAGQLHHPAAADP